MDEKIKRAARSEKASSEIDITKLGDLFVVTIGEAVIPNVRNYGICASSHSKAQITLEIVSDDEISRFSMSSN